jgi:hypothetical protein
MTTLADADKSISNALRYVREGTLRDVKKLVIKISTQRRYCDEHLVNEALMSLRKELNRMLEEE